MGIAYIREGRANPELDCSFGVAINFSFAKASEDLKNLSYCDRGDCLRQGYYKKGSPVAVPRGLPTAELMTGGN